MSLKSYWMKLPLVANTFHNITHGMFWKFLWKNFRNISWRWCKLGILLFVLFGFRHWRIINILQIQNFWLNYQVNLCGQCSEGFLPVNFIKNILWEYCKWKLPLFNTQLQYISLGYKRSIKICSYQPFDS